MRQVHRCYHRGHWDCYNRTANPCLEIRGAMPLHPVVTCSSRFATLSPACLHSTYLRYCENQNYQNLPPFSTPRSALVTPAEKHIAVQTMLHSQPSIPS